MQSIFHEKKNRGSSTKKKFKKVESKTIINKTVEITAHLEYNCSNHSSPWAVITAKAVVGTAHFEQ